MQLVLASTSPYRRELLERLGLPFEQAAPACDERAVEEALGSASVEEIVRHLARAKAQSLAARYPDALLIGSDQLAELDGERLGKPGTEEAACAQLRRLAGREHRLWTAVAIHQPRTGRLEEALGVHRLRMRAVGDRAIEDYVRRDQPLDCAGAYRIESLGVALFEALTGDDYTGIVGLPLTRVVELLARFGVRVLG